MRPILAAALVAALPAVATAQTTTTGTATTAGTATTTGSANCTAIVQAAAGEIEARIAADDQTINPPQSVFNLTCLSNFFNGIGLNVVTNLLNPGNLLTAVEGQLCSVINQAWQSTLGSAQCGLTITGFNLGFGGLGGGLMCPKLSFGGGGPPITSFGLGASTTNGGGLSINGTATPPTGYTVPPTLGGLY